MSSRVTLAVLLLVCLAPRMIAAGPAVLEVQALRCESAAEPLGVDHARPRLSWQLRAPAETRAKSQSAYEIVVASSLEFLARKEGDLWGSGKVVTPVQAGIVYDGKPLASSQQAFWTVRVWDEADSPSAWSGPASWTMGLLFEDDWHGARWITDGGLLRYQRSAVGFRTRDAEAADTVKWVAVDLGREYAVDLVRLRGVAHEVAENLGMPVRFRIEVATRADFSDARVIMDQTGRDFPNRWAKRIDATADGQRGRHVRLTATRLRVDDEALCLALGQLEVYSGQTNVAPGSTVTASDSVEAAPWSSAALVDGLGTPESNPRRNGTLRVGNSIGVRRDLKRAVAHLCGLGHYELEINGSRHGDTLLNPGWSDTGATVYYDTRDITKALREGANRFELTLAGGMYNVAEGRYTKFTTPFRPLIARVCIRLEYADGSVDHVVSGSDWRVGEGPITFSNMFGGEDYDARRASVEWRPATAVRGPGGALRAAAHGSPPFRVHGILDPISARDIGPGATVYDLGQNVSLMLRLRVRGPAGSSVKVVPAELLRADGTVDRGSCAPGRVEASWNYILGGESAGETWEPRFFYHGSRYLEVRLNPDREGGELPKVEAIQGLIVHSDSPPAGEFECSSDLFNRIRTLIRWAQRSNLAHVITDCPHRERLGWLEQYHLHGPSLRYEWNLDRLWTKTLRDMADSQTPAGLVPDIAPEYVVFGQGFRDSPEWGGSYVIVPWQHYEWTGDVAPLREHYEGMKRYVDYLGTKAADHILSHGLGDWYDLGPNRPGNAQLTPVPLTATAYYFLTADIIARAARVLEHDADAAKYGSLAREIRTAFNRKFFNDAEGSYATGSQTANAMPLVLGLVPLTRRADVLSALVRDVEARDYSVTAGDVGHRYLLRALADGGCSEEIFKLHSQTNRPGYGYILNRGATSLTEAWDANRNSSQNHFMLGHITEWFYHDLAGIRPDPQAPGFGNVIIQPQPVGDLSWVRARFESVRGPIVSSWKRQGRRFTIEVEIPPNMTATLHLPDGSVEQAGSGRHERTVEIR